MIRVTNGAAVRLAQDHRPHAAAPIVAYGDHAVLRIPHHIADLGARRVMLVCGRTSFEASGASQMLPDLENVADVRRWSEFVPNTDSADLRVGLEIVREFQPDLVLGVGGGSALDMAKLLCTFHDVPDEAVLDHIRSGYKPAARDSKLVLVPTTSGSGAEATHFAVVYIGNDKYSIGGEGMRPDAIALDPKLSVTGSPYQRATSGIDAVCQAIESLWATGATDRSRHFARTALRVLMPAIERFVNDPDAQSARAMTIGSHFAGRAIDISRTTAAHALSYGITKTYGISHGHAVAITLPAFLQAHAEAGSVPFQESVPLARHTAAMNEILDSLNATNGSEASSVFTEFLRRIGLDPSLTNAGAPIGPARNALAASVNTERLGNNPIALSPGQLADLLNSLD